MKVLPVLIFIITALVVNPGTGGDYLLIDDNEYVTENPYILSGLSLHGVVWAFTHTFSGHWHPLTWISLMLDISIFGKSSDASRAVNIVLHSLAAAILFFPIKRLLGNAPLATCALLLFSINPLRLESVLWISERKDVLSFFFFACTLAIYDRYLLCGARKLFFCSVGIAALGMLAKPSLVPLPILLILWNYLHTQEKLNQRLVVTWITRMWPFWLLSFGVSCAAIIGQRASGGLQSVDQLSFAARLNNVAIGYLAYLGKLVFPFHLSIFYPLQNYPTSIGAGAWILLLLTTYFLLAPALTGNTLSRKLLAASWIWFIVSLAPVIGIVQIGWQQFADRWSYIPHLLPVVSLCFLGADFLKKPLWLIPIGLACISLLTIETTRLAPLWLSSERLFSHALRHTSQNFFIHTNYGVALERKGDSSGAMSQYREALKFHPDYPLALNNVGSLLANEGRYSESVIFFRKALAKDPNFTTARYHLGLALSRISALPQAFNEWLLILQESPDHPDTRTAFLSVVDLLPSEECSSGEVSQILNQFRDTVSQLFTPSQLAALTAKGCLTQQK